MRTEDELKVSNVTHTDNELLSRRRLLRGAGLLAGGVVAGGSLLRATTAHGPPCHGIALHGWPRSGADIV